MAPDHVTKAEPHYHANEIDILYHASNKLAQAVTASELLDAVSDYALSIGATTGRLTYLYGDSITPLQWGELVAEWFTHSNKLTSEVGRRFEDYGSDYASTRGWVEHPYQPMLVTNAVSSNLFHEEVRDRFQKRAINSVAVLPLNKRGRWVGVITFGWSEPYFFTERDRRIFTALMQQTAPIIDSLRLFAHIQERVSRAERLLQVNTALSQATDEAQILAAIALYTEKKEADGLVLNYLDIDEDGNPKTSWPMALWRDGKASLYDPQTSRLTSLADFGFAALWVHQPQKVLLIEDISNDPRIVGYGRAAMLERLETRALALIPLYSNARYQGVMTILWFKSHVFSEEEKYVYTLLMQTLPSVVATRRAYLAEEEARQENEFLYRASQAINAATSYVEIIEAVSFLNLQSLFVTLTIWENYDFEKATYLHAITTSVNNRGSVDIPIPLADIPLVFSISQSQLLVVEDTSNRKQIDEVTAATIEQFGIRSFTVVPLMLGHRYIGNFVFQSTTPRIPVCHNG